MCYILPKFQVRFAEERGADMVSCVRLDLADSPLKVQEACHHRSRKTYDLYRHIYLRQSFVTIWVTEEKRCINCHRDFISGGGFTEPSLFVAGLLQDKDFLSPICAGPVFSRARKKPKRKAKPKRSERTRAMLAPPESSQPCAGYECGPLNEMKVVEDMTEFLPGLPASSKASWLKILFPVSSSKISI